MAIPTSRTQSEATVCIETALCTGCGQCVAVCKDFGLRLEGGKACLAAWAVPIAWLFALPGP